MPSIGILHWYIAEFIRPKPDFLDHCHVHVDLASKAFCLLRPIINTLPVQTLRVKDEQTITSRFLYDMGAGLNMMLSTDFIKDSEDRIVVDVKIETVDCKSRQPQLVIV